ncbi:hypothetical protein DYB37_005152 [Aphanomyces astaci]|uniref:Serine-threonine/tyrosine-protein kinase catalytic domain-containing protein n=1 Tax=Aphanomyces astaci TaxID=112090 RepID=A0A418EJA0_APHAT|nr:hypothetical protein DYB37_005152 [Aphanomyces astaci]
MNPLQVPLLVCQEGLRPSNFKNPAPENYVALMHECWDGDMDKRPSFAHIYQRLHGISVQYQQQTDLVCSHEAMIKKIPIKQSRSKTGSTLVTTEQIKTLRKTYLRGKR